MSGNGSATNPYIVRSTKGFLWLSNSAVSGIYMSNKYIQICCDIVLNEECFDKSGKPSGGDGVVYQWQPISHGANSDINFNNHSILGLFFNDEGKETVSLFGSVQIYNVSNLNFKNIFIKAKKKVAALCFISRGTIRNCKVLSGSLIGESYVASLVSENGNIIEDCENYATIEASGNNASGLTNGLGNMGEINNCSNYGDVSAHTWVGGLYCATFGGTKYINNCNNYGKIVSEDGRVGGIMGSYIASSGKLYIDSCKNFGEVFGGISYGAVAGIIGIAYGFVQISNSSNYADVYSRDITAGIVANVSVGSDNVKEGRIDIINCYNHSSNSIIGAVSAGQKDYVLEVSLKGVENNYTRKNDAALVQYAKQSNGGVLKLFVKDCKINLLSKEIFTGNAIVRFLTGNIYLDKVLINANCINSNFKQFLMNNQSEQLLNLNNIVINNLESKWFAGSDFSGFYVDFKTGQIGLKAFSGKGFYQGKVTEELLLAKGYEKKAI